ncbi:hypothetical protein GCM10009753_21270 [Streptantibioticus ferralitis]
MADRADAVAKGRSASTTALGPGAPSGTSNHHCTHPPRADELAPAAAVAHYRRRNDVPREHRVHPRFNDDEWAKIVSAAKHCKLTPGGITAAAALAYARADRRASTAVEQQQLEELMRSNTALATVGTPLNDLAHLLNSGSTPHRRHAQWLLDRVISAVNRADRAVVSMTRMPAAGTSDRTASREIAQFHRQRLPEPRENRSHPCFSDDEWADVTAAAGAMKIRPGAYAAATTLAAASTADPRVAIADTHRQLEELMESNRQLAAFGNNLNQLLVHLHPHAPLHDQAHRTLRHVQDVLDHVDATATELAWG